MGRTMRIFAELVAFLLVAGTILSPKWFSAWTEYPWDAGLGGMVEPLPPPPTAWP